MSTTAKTVLIADDEPNILISLEFLMKREGHTVRLARNGIEALAAIQQIKPDLVLLDVMMPGGLDGFEVCEQIKADARLTRTPVVILTARSQDRDRQAGERVGADAFLAKPFSPMQLVETVSSMLNAAEPTGSAA